MNKGYVYFRLQGDAFDPDLVSRRLGIEPTRTARKGSPVPKCTSWVLSSETLVCEVLDIYEMSRTLIDQLAPKTEAIRHVVEEFDLKAVLQVVLWITVDDSKPTPAIGFDKETIQFLSNVRASVDIDTYREGEGGTIP